MSVFILDTDHISLHQRGHSLIQARITALPKNKIVVTVVSYEEQVRGRLAQIRRAKKETQVILAYERLREAFNYFTQMPMLDFDVAASAQYQLLRQQRLRVGTQDLRIAAIALANGCTVVTRNLRDFGRVPSLVVEDWSQ